MKPSGLITGIFATYFVCGDFVATEILEIFRISSTCRYCSNLVSFGGYGSNTIPRFSKNVEHF